MNINKDTMNFLETLLFVASGDGTDNGPAFYNKTVYDFAPAFIAGVEKFVGAFKEHLRDECFPLTDLERRLEDAERSFGGNVFFSLSGHGCGFFDDSDEEVAEVHDRLKAWAGGCRFEGLESMLGLDDDGKIDLAILPAALDEYRAKMFAVPEKKVPPPEKEGHTPGPWYSKDTSAGQSLIASEANGATVAIAYDTKDGGLLAAAPELLEALTEVMKFWTGSKDDEMPAKVFDDAMRIILKAKGGVA